MQGTPHSLALIKFAHSDICPAVWIQYYITVCQCLKVSLDQGYLIRTAVHSRSIKNKPFTGSAVNNRLLKHLSEAKLYARETPHSFRVGLSNTLRLLGCSLEDVAHYLSWKSEVVAKRYMQGSDATVSLTLLEKVFPGAASGTVNPVSHPDNLQAAVWIMFCCVCSITALAFLFCLGLG